MNWNKNFRYDRYVYDWGVDYLGKGMKKIKKKNIKWGINNKTKQFKNKTIQP